MAPTHQQLEARLRDENRRQRRLEWKIADAEAELEICEANMVEAENQARRLGSIIRQFPSSAGRYELERKLRKAEDKYNLNKARAYRATSRLERLWHEAADSDDVMAWVLDEMPRARFRDEAECQRFACAEAEWAQQREAQARHQRKSETKHQRKAESKHQPKADFEGSTRRRDSATESAKPQTPSLSDLKRWRDYTEICFKDYSAIKRFPAPPGQSCQKADCQAMKAHRYFEACDCNIKEAFVRLGIDPKKERLRWHPDKFAVCGMEKEAKEVFILLDAMCREK